MSTTNEQEPTSFICLDEAGNPYCCKLTVEVGERVIPQYTHPPAPKNRQEDCKDKREPFCYYDKATGRYSDYSYDCENPIPLYL